MKIGVELKQKQTLILTPELRQSINMLQYSSIELNEFLQQQTEENPVLEIKEKSNEHFITRNSKYSSFGPYNKDLDYDPINQYSNTHHSLERHLMEQINTIPGITSEKKNILSFLIGHLNRHGLLEIEPEFATKLLSVSLAEVEDSITILQSLDPVGVGARNFKECLLIQMKAQSFDYHLAYIMIDKHIEDVAANRFQKLSKIYNVTLKEVQDAMDYIKTLNPRPCMEFNHEITHYIQPDVIVKKVNDNYIIIVNESILPQLSINPLYQNNSMGEKDDYLKEKSQEATILLNGMEQRKYTLYKVTQVFLNMQKDFFKNGITKLKPMTLKDVSGQTGFHESTISRATSNKYIQTPHGIFHIKSLFTTGLSKNNSVEAESTVSIKEKIKNLINKENKESPLSDQNIATILHQEGIQISRRTVAKYREEVGIPSSSKRRIY